MLQWGALLFLASGITKQGAAFQGCVMDCFLILLLAQTEHHKL